MNCWDRNLSGGMLKRNTYGLAGSLLLVQCKAKERQRDRWRTCNVIVNHIKDIKTMIVLCYKFAYSLSYHVIA